MRVFEYSIKSDQKTIPTIISIGAKNQFDALRKLADKLQTNSMIGTIKNIEQIK